MRPTSAGTNLAINAIRSIAALAVVVSHLRALFFVDYSHSDAKGPLAQGFYLLGSLGHPAVIVFFVLSGFWVGGSVIRGISNETFDLRFYSTSRLTRLWIVLIPAILLTQLLDRIGTALLPLSAVYSGTSAYHTVVPSDGAINHLDPVTTLGNLFFLQSIHVETIGTDTALWSLAYEFWFYLLFPAALVAFTPKYRARVRLMAASLFIVGAWLAGFGVLVLFPTWLFGAAIAWQRHRILAIWNKLASGWRVGLRVILTVALFGACVAWVGLDLPPPAKAFLVAVIAGLLIASLIADVTQPQSTAGLRVFSWSADWSYSLYATHLPIIALLAGALVPSAADRWQLSPIRVLEGAGILAIAMISAYLFYLATEKHTAGMRKLLLRWGRRPTAAAGAARPHQVPTL